MGQHCSDCVKKILARFVTTVEYRRLGPYPTMIWSLIIRRRNSFITSMENEARIRQNLLLVPPFLIRQSATSHGYSSSARISRTPACDLSIRRWESCWTKPIPVSAAAFDAILVTDMPAWFTRSLMPR